MAKEVVLREAEFNRNVRIYWLLSGALVLTVTVFGIVLLPFWFLFGMLVTEKYLQRMSCTLTRRSLKVSKGVFVRQERTIPLDKVTDLGVVQGPIMRLFGIEAISVETAGQSSPGALITLTGILNGREFRDAVLDQRDKVVADAEEQTPRQAPAAISGAPATGLGNLEHLLTDIRDTLARIDQRLEKERTG
jgi:putative membrane protein